MGRGGGVPWWEAAGGLVVGMDRAFHVKVKVNNTPSIPHKAGSGWGYFFPERCGQAISVPP